MRAIGQRRDYCKYNDGNGDEETKWNFNSRQNIASIYDCEYERIETMKNYVTE